MSSILIRRANIVSGGSGPTPPIDYSTRYLTFEALEAGTFTFTIPAGITASHVPSVSYSTDDGNTWTTVTNSDSDVVIATPTIPAGGKVLWKSEAIRFGTNTTNYCQFSSSGNYNASGNIMSMLYGDSFADKVELKNYTYTFIGLFRGSSNLISAENLIMPATALTNNCYRTMFYQCSNLTTAPSLPASTLVVSCYQYMFMYCKKLSYVKCLATDISASNCTTTWLTNAASEGTFVKAASMTGWSSGASGIPSGWTVQDAS